MKRHITGVFFVDIAEQYAEKVYLANSHELKAFAKSHKKTDKIDAKLIADVLRKGYLPTAFIADKATREKREIIRYRRNIVKERSSTIHKLKNLLDKIGEKASGNFTTHSRLNKIPLDHLPERYKYIANEYIDKIEGLLLEDREAKKYIKKIASKDPDIINLVSIPGIDWFSGLLIKTEIADIKRFRSFNRLCSYAGLAPRVSQSGKKCKIGKLNRNRRRKLQWILLENAFIFMQKLPKYRKKYERVSSKKNHNTARDFLKIICHVLKEKRMFYYPYVNDIKPGSRRLVRSSTV